MNHLIDIEPKHLLIVKNILKSHLTPNSKVWAFGSRVTGKAKKYSDLDLAIDASRPLSLHLTTKLSDDFEESMLPYKIDFIDWQTISNEFKKTIKNDLIPLAF